jgi:hypothetical protein
MKILLALSSPEYLRFFDATVVELARRGHEVAIAVSRVKDGKPARFETIEGTGLPIAVVGVTPPRGDRWAALAQAVRGTMDTLRYRHPRLAHAGLLRARVRRLALPWVLGSLDRPEPAPAPDIGRTMTRLAALERAIPPAPALVSFLREQGADLLLVSPLVEPASEQVDLIRAAQAIGLRVGTLVASWDNLTNKGDLKVATPFIAVWNAHQREEAVTLHRVPAESVVVTGAQPFDRWFERQPSLTRDAFVAQVGLPAGRPFVLFTGSSIFIARAEVEIPFVRRWIEALRASPDPAVRDLAVLVRPHPYNGKAWPANALADLPDVAVWPAGGYDPADERNRAGLFHSLTYSDAVVGINTSAMIEAAIVGRPVLTIEADEFAGTQDGTVHYHYLLPENGGFLRVASTLAQHVEQLAAVLREPEAARAELARFVGTFIRPHGLDRPVTPLLADAIERFGATPAPAPVTATAGDLVRRAALYPLAWLAPLCPPETNRRVSAWRHPRDWWQYGRRATRKAAKAIAAAPARLPGRTAKLVRRTRRAAGEAARAGVGTPVRGAVRFVRRMRYHVGVFARRLRGAPIE